MPEKKEKKKVQNLAFERLKNKLPEQNSKPCIFIKTLHVTNAHSFGTDMNNEQGYTVMASFLCSKKRAKAISSSYKLQVYRLYDDFK